MDIQQSPYRSKPVFTFVLKDAGETRALQPVMAKLDRQQVNYAILSPEGSTAKTLTTNNPHNVNNHDSYQVNQALNAPIAVTGVVSNFQNNMANWFKVQHKTVVGFYDGFSVFPSNMAQVQSFQKLLDTLIVPSKPIARLFEAIFSNKVIALGHSTLEKTAKVLAPEKIAALQEQLNLDPTKSTLLFVGSYGETYADNFALFCQMAPQLKARYNLLISLHPSQNGRYEQDQLTKYGLANDVRILPKTVTTQHVLPLAQGILAPYPSTLATQALFQQKTVFLLKAGSSPQTLYDPSLTAPNTTIISSPENCQSIVENELSKTIPDPAFLYRQFEIPQQATQSITNYLNTLLSAKSQPAITGEKVSA